MKITYKVESEKTLIQVLREDMDLSSRIIRRLKREKKVTVNDMVISFNARLRVGDQVVANLPKEENIFNPEDIPIDVRYADDHFLVINKQAFLVVHPTKGHPFGTIANGLAQYMLDQGDEYKIRFANRLDRDTSGLMIVCKSGFGHKIISDQMHQNTMIKEYDALVMGQVSNDQGTIKKPIGRAYEDSIHRIVRPDGAPCVTHYKVMKRFEDRTWLRIRIETGRTHQIRVHMKHLGHSIMGDVLYGGNHEAINRQALHACHLVFKDANGKQVDVEADMPEDMKRLME
ncbi:RluA family pseudouridine synthase [Acidaminobacter sp. JC074]|uniref:RluA family pseudouridine synthase n=1 Tax=Acidaminobacter sp. JC074 TaxID=2530199 RepID=UPI001F10A4FC|nr:RluA family pseudouridine synthase [Acidaminobacter sp. JC074]MCH4890752.1 RluA family pseudouridine synthase [Acidaminobacter sp. JC074]